MLSITDGEALKRALDSPINNRLKKLLALRRHQLGGDIADQAHFAIVQPGDTLADLERTAGFPAFSDAYFSPEWVQDHGFAYECVHVLTDDGFAHVAIIPRQSDIDSELLQFCQTYVSEHA